MQVMKYICVAVALGMWFTIAIAQQAAPAQNAPVVKHVPIKDTPSNSRIEQQRDIPVAARRISNSRTGGNVFPRQPGHASLGTVVLQHQSGP